MLIRLIFVFLFSVTHVLAGELGATQWLEKMNQAMKQLNYQGTVAFVKNGRLDSMKYFHAVDKGVEQELLLSLNSPMREVVREAGKVRCTFKETGKVIIDHRPVSNSFLVNLPADFSAMNDVYHFSIMGEEFVALRPARVIFIQAKDKFRFGRKIWIDTEYFLPLKVEIFDLLGTTLEQVVFTDIEVVSQLAFSQRKNRDALDVKHINLVESPLLVDKVVVLGDIPAKFKIIYFSRMTNKEPTISVDHLVLSDGFSSVSVYREAKANDAKTGLQTMGIFNLFTQVVDNHQVTAMGEVPAKTVQFIAKNVTFL